MWCGTTFGREVLKINGTCFIDPLEYKLEKLGYALLCIADRKKQNKGSMRRNFAAIRVGEGLSYCGVGCRRPVQIFCKSLAANGRLSCPCARASLSQGEYLCVRGFWGGKKWGKQHTPQQHQHGKGDAEEDDEVEFRCV
jgi:hypothetical protein